MDDQLPATFFEFLYVIIFETFQTISADQFLWKEKMFTERIECFGCGGGGGRGQFMAPSARRSPRLVLLPIATSLPQDVAQRPTIGGHQ